MAVPNSVPRRIYKTLGSLRTGIILLIIVAIVSAAGTVILQRPLTEPDQMERTYSPQTLRILDALSLTDVFHAWWFALLLALVSTSIIFVSIDRWPNAWRFFARPYRRPDSHFRAVLPAQFKLPVRDAAAGLSVAERAFRKQGLKPERVVDHDEVSLYAERNRSAVLAMYVIHASLLLIFLGGIIDAFWGYKGYINLVPGEQTNQVAMQKANAVKVLPFSIRCDGTGQENYDNGMPKKWWSKLVILEGGQETYRKEIVVNDPLVYNGIRFFQAGYGRSDKPQGFVLRVLANPGSPAGSPAWQPPDRVKLTLDQAAQVDPNTSVRVTKFIPDAYEMDGGVYQRSKELRRPGLRLLVESRDPKSGAAKSSESWVLWDGGMAGAQNSPYSFELVDLDLAFATGLQVSHEPGQWAVWGGVILMAIGLSMAFYLVHMRFWAVVVQENGASVLWVGAAPSKHREAFEQRFQDLKQAVQDELNNEPEQCAVAHASSMASI